MNKNRKKVVPKSEPGSHFILTLCALPLLSFNGIFWTTYETFNNVCCILFVLCRQHSSVLRSWGMVGRGVWGMGWHVDFEGHRRSCACWVGMAGRR
ncbi:hypothetical protein Hdeb2414_s0558g00916471 [Helianthus debilis subsp. tardiflorus]